MILLKVHIPNYVLSSVVSPTPSLPGISDAADICITLDMRVYQIFLWKRDGQ
jgi:hypothetical protein